MARPYILTGKLAAWAFDNHHARAATRSRRQLSRDLGVSLSTVQRAITPRPGSEDGTRALTRDQVARIVENDDARRYTVSDQVAARILGVSIETVRSVAKPQRREAIKIQRVMRAMRQTEMRA